MRELQSDLPMRMLLLLSTAIIVNVGLSGVAGAQYPYPPYGSYANTARPMPPPASWSYNPYTNGITACPQWDPHDAASCTTLVPSYGQPSYSTWMTR